MIQLARERGLRGYSRLKKSELIRKLRAPILDQDIDARMVNMPFLTPTPYTPPQATLTQYTPPQATPTPSSNADKNLLDYLDNIKEIP